MTHLRPGDEVVCIDAGPVEVNLSTGDRLTHPSRLERRAVYRVKSVLALPSDIVCDTGAKVAICLHGVVSPYFQLLGVDGYEPCRFRKVVRTGRSAAVADLMKVAGVAERREGVEA